MAENRVHEAIWALIKSFQEANQVVTESVVVAQEQNRRLAQSFFADGMEVLKANQAAAESLTAAQERNMQYAQRFFTEGMEILERQVESMRVLMQELEQQARKQQEALQTLANESVDTYIDFLRTPLSYYQQTLDAAETLTRRGLENFQKATQQMHSAMQKMNEQ
jgi:signal transduction histidine kinase